MNWAMKVCDARLERDCDGDESTDAFSRFITSAKSDKDEQCLSRLHLYGDAFSFIVAGSHTIASTLTMMFYELARQPLAQERIRQELVTAGVAISGSQNSHALEAIPNSTLERLPYLDACITETLRLYPAVPTGSIRQTTTKAIRVGDNLIPPDTIIVSPRWTIGRCMLLL